MQIAQRPGAARSAGARSARILLALATLAGVFNLTVVGAEPAGAYTAQQTPNQIVFRSNRLSQNQTHVTVTVTMRSNGDYGILVEAHCTAATRKWVEASATVRSPALFGHRWQFDPGEDRRRVDPGEWDEWGDGGNDPYLAERWDEFINDPDAYAEFRMWANRIR